MEGFEIIMKIQEYYAKEILSWGGIPIPRGETADSPKKAAEIFNKIGGSLAIKAQVLTGGRGKAGGIKIARSPIEAIEKAEEILSMKIKGIPVKRVLVEEALQIKKEYYLSITMDRSSGKNVIMLSSMGGVDIEETAANNPEMIIKEYVDPLLGLLDFQINNLVYSVEIPNEALKSLKQIIKALYKTYIHFDCMLAEINPLVLLPGNTFIAADAKILLDENSFFRQNNIKEKLEHERENPLEITAHKQGISYVYLGGDVGIIGNGAGLVMCTLDMVARAGGKPANFLDIGGGAKADLVEKSLSLILSDKDVKGIFINIFGGITRCDEAAKGIIQGVNKTAALVPIVIRLCGTNEKEGKKLLKDAGCKTVDTMLEGAAKIVELINAGN